MNFYAKELLTDGTEKIHSFSSELDLELFIARKTMETRLPVVLKLPKSKAISLIGEKV